MIDDFISFLNRSPTSWHAANEIAVRLTGFTRLSEEEGWRLEKGKGYYLVRDGSAVAAFRLPKKKMRRAVLLATHLDSPSLKLKPIADAGGSGQISQFFTELYGSPLLHTWLDRDLCLAGRVVDKAGQSKLVFLKDHPLIIPSLAPHFDKGNLDKGLQINRQDHLRPIVSLSREKPLGLAQILNEEPIAFDLFLVPLEQAAFLGQQKEMIASARLDNLTSAYAALYGMTASEAQDDALQIALFFDHEEVGSGSYLGAESSFLSQTLDRIAFHEGLSGDDLFSFRSRTWCISADAAHGYHPNFADRFDPKNAPWLGDGVILKTNGQMRYATTATSAAPLIRLCRKKDIPLQTFASRSDIPSGSTVGSIVSAACGVSTVDIGIGMLAMHSIRETISTQDQILLCKLLKEALHDARES